MKVFALSDPHLALSAPYQDGQKPQIYKPMDIFGAQWQDYYRQLRENWLALISPEDVVLMPGDISWAMTLDETQYDFQFLGALSGSIVINKGNHDYWWQSISRVRAALPPNITALQHNSIIVGGRAVCASRGWLTPGHPDFQGPEDEKIFQREILRMEMALREGAKSGLPLVAMMHYPPLNQDGESNALLDLLENFSVNLCLYGHIHGLAARHVPQGLHNGMELVNVSCDRLGFQPKFLWEQ